MQLLRESCIKESMNLHKSKKEIKRIKENTGIKESKGNKFEVENGYRFICRGGQVDMTRLLLKQPGIPRL